MTTRSTNVVVLGSTGSIGRSTLEVIAASGGALRVTGLAGHSNTTRLEQQAKTFLPRWVAVTDAEAARSHDWSGLPKDVELLVGPEAVSRMVTDPDVATVVSAVVGSAGLQGTWAAVEAGKTVALANKESMVMGGPLITRLARECRAQILPLDSEHSAGVQALQVGPREEL